MSPLGLREAREGDPGQAEPGGHAQPFVEGQSPWGPSSADRAGVQAGGEMERWSDWRLCSSSLYVVVRMAVMTV